jgi:Leucine-rich repeat (LRR) protein
LSFSRCSLVFSVQSTSNDHVSTEYSTENCTIYIHQKRCDECFVKYCNKDCKILNIISNELEVIPHGIYCFTGLDELYADNLKITVLEGFQTDLGLKILNLSKNNLSDINVDNFVGLRKLKKLFLTENKRTTLNPGYFHGLEKLLELDLSSNKITMIPLSIFDSLKNLEVFKMESNQLKTIEINRGQIYNTFSIKNLNLNNNNLIQVTNLMYFNNMEKLDLSDNPNLKWNSIPFSQMKRITHLTLNNANLNATNIHLIRPLKKLQNLSIADNNFKELNVSVLPQLDYLQYFCLKQHSTIKILDYNLLKQRFPNLTTIDITGREWSCEFLKDWISYLQKLEIEWPDKNETIRMSKCKDIGELTKLDVLRIAGIAVFSITLILIICYAVQKRIIYSKSKSENPEIYGNIKSTSVGTETDVDVINHCSDPTYVEMNKFGASEAIYMTMTADTHYDTLNWTNTGK